MQNMNSSQRNFKTYTLGLIADQDYTLRVPGNMYSVINSSSDFSITFDQSNKLVSQEAGMGATFNEEYSDIVVRSATAQSVTIVFGFGQFSDARASVNATVNTTIAPSDTVNNPGDVACAASATLLISANSNRKEVEICVPSTESDPIRVGNASVTSSSGSIIEPGTSKTFACEAALYGIRTGSTTTTATVFELERP